MPLYALGPNRAMFIYVERERWEGERGPDFGVGREWVEGLLGGTGGDGDGTCRTAMAVPLPRGSAGGRSSLSRWEDRHILHALQNWRWTLKPQHTHGGSSFFLQLNEAEGI